MNYSTEAAVCNDSIIRTESTYMTSAFSPVAGQRAGSPVLNSVRLPSRGRPRRSSKRVRQSSSLSEMIGRNQNSSSQQLAQVCEGSRETESPPLPDHVSTSASEAEASATSQSPKILDDFIGATCEVTSWFTPCFPCTVVNINEEDGHVADKLSKERAMNVMYATSPNTPNSMEASHNDHEPSQEDLPPAVISPQIEDVGSNLMYTHLPIMTVTNPSEYLKSQWSDRQLHLIEDDNTTEVETVDNMSLDSPSPVVSPINTPPQKKHTILPRKMKKLFSSKKKSDGRPPLIRS